MKVKMTAKVKMTQNKEHAQKIIAKLEENGGYCPCKLIHNEDTLCKCKEFREQIAAGEYGECHCGLWEVTE